MSNKNLKLPLIFSLLDDYREDLGDWREQLETGRGVGDWTLNDIVIIIGGYLAKYDKLLALVNGIKLSKEDKSDLTEYRAFFKEYKEFWQEAKEKCIQKGAQNGIRS